MTVRRRSARRAGVAVTGSAVLAALLVPAAAAATVRVELAPTVVINEVLTSNFNGAVDERGKQADWVELYNPAAAAVDLTGWGLSNTAKSPFRWVFPAGTTIAARGYLRVWADKTDRRTSTANLHTSFNLDNGADAVVLTAPNGTLTGLPIDATTPARTRPDVSWCRTPGGPATAVFVHCLTPTPSAVNAGETAAELLPAPTVSAPSGLLAGPTDVTVSGPADAELRYTTDGSEPVATSPLVTGPLPISRSTVLRVGAFRAGAVPSYTTTATYVLDPAGSFTGRRVLFVTMPPANRTAWFGGGNAPTSGWRSAVELVDENGTRAFAADAATEQAGQTGSRVNQKKLPLDIRFSDATGYKSVSYPIFSDRPGTTSFKKLRLRNAGNDSKQAHLRDQFWQQVGAGGNGLLGASSEPVQVFANGTYYGMMDLREKEDEGLVEAAFGVDKDTVDYLSEKKVLSGEQAAANWTAVDTWLRKTNMSVPANYARAGQIFDVETFAADWALHLFSVNRDWMGRNTQYFAMPSYDGRWRYRPHDFDITSESTSAGRDARAGFTMNGEYKSVHAPGAIMRSLLRSPQFKTLYANVIADQLNTNLAPASSQAVLDRMAAEMEPYLPAHITATGGTEITSVSAWRSQVGRLRTFLTARIPQYVSHTRSHLGLGTLLPVTVGVSDPAAGTVTVNTVTVDRTTWTGSYWKGLPITLTAVPRPGYVFTGWQGNDSSTARTITPRIDAAGRSFTATFAPIADTPIGTAPAPVVEPVPDRTATTGTVLTLDVRASDPTGYRLTYSAKSLPAGLDIHPVTGRIYGRPTRGGSYASTVSVSNGTVTTKLPITWTVSNALDRVVTLPRWATGDGTGLTATYFSNLTLAGVPALTRVEAPSVAAPGAPVAGFPTSKWTVRWTGTITAPADGVYPLRALLRTDDAVRVQVGGLPVLDTWTARATAATGSVTLVAGVPTPITVEFLDSAGAAALDLSWQLPGEPVFSPIDVGVLNP